jgi:hypothetical protein
MGLRIEWLDEVHLAKPYHQTWWTSNSMPRSLICTTGQILRTPHRNRSPQYVLIALSMNMNLKRMLYDLLPAEQLKEIRIFRRREPPKISREAKAKRG